MSSDDSNIHSTYMKMRDELQTVVYTTTSLGGIMGFLASVGIAGISDVRRFGLIVCGCLVGLYLGRKRKQDIQEKRLIIASQLDLHDLVQKPVVAEEVKKEEPKVEVVKEEKPAATEPVVETSKPEAEPKSKKVAVKKKPKG